MAYLCPLCRNTKCFCYPPPPQNSASINSNADSNGVISQQESDEIDHYLTDYLHGVVVTRSYKDDVNQTISCVDIYTQSTLNDPAFKNHKIQLQPSPELISKFNIKIKQDNTITPCPKGSVGMILPSRERILKAGSLQKFFSRHHEHSSVVNGKVPPSISPLSAAASVDGGIRD